MASTYSPNLRLELIGSGEQSGTWGNTTNTNLGTLIDSAVAGYVAVDVGSSAQALTANNGVADESRMASLELSTSTSANFAVYAPPNPKQYVVANTSAYTATIYNSTVLGNTTAAGSGVAIPAGFTFLVWSDGTNFYTIDAGGGGYSTNTPNTLVKRDGSGNFAAGAVTVTGLTSTGTVAVGANSITTTNWTIVESGGTLYFKYGGVNKFALTSAGAITAVDNVTAYGTL